MVVGLFRARSRARRETTQPKPTIPSALKPLNSGVIRMSRTLSQMQRALCMYRIRLKTL